MLAFVVSVSGCVSDGDSGASEQDAVSDLHDALPLKSPERCDDPETIACTRTNAARAGAKFVDEFAGTVWNVRYIGATVEPARVAKPLCRRESQPAHITWVTPPGRMMYGRRHGL